jgi:hypothetical protein
VAEVISHQALSGLIGSIYDCAIDPSRWEQTLIAIKDAFDCDMSVIGLGDFRQQRFLFLKAVGFEPCQMENSRNIWLRSAPC